MAGALTATSLLAQELAQAPPGIAWDVRGSWQSGGTSAPIKSGDPIRPGSLLQAGDGDANHSITILLPDGLRILYQCFTQKDCARGFRVPLLYRKPDPFAVGMLARIRAVLAEQKRERSSGEGSAAAAARDETVAVLEPGNSIEVGGLAAALSDGAYTYNLRPMKAGFPPESDLPLEKSGRTITLKVPSAGLYNVTIFDRLKTPRINYLVGAVAPASSAEVVKQFQDAHALFMEWKENFQPWPIHDFQRAYLESLMLGVQPQPGPRQTESAAELPGSGVTAEPAFSPQPGVFQGDTAVTLRCATPGAVLHYTVDSSQPFDTSPVYRAPIILKGTELTVKAFASSPGRKDSPVVIGIFRIQQR